MIDLEALSEEISAPDDNQVSNIAQLASRQVSLENAMKDLEEQQKKLKAEWQKVSQDLLPEAMFAAGVSELSLENGTRITVQQDVKAGITEKNKEWCFQWLREHGHGSIIRNEFSVSFGINEDQKAQVLADTLRELHNDYNQKQYIHHRTLPAWVRTELEENEHDEEWEKRFGVFRFKQAKIERP